MEKVKRHATHAISGFELTKDTLNNLSQYDITPTAKLVLLYLTSCYNPKNADVFPKQKTIAAKLGVSERSVTRAVQELFKARLILIECKSSNRYFLRLQGDCGASGIKNFVPNKLADVMCKKVTLQSDKLSYVHVHEQLKETKKEPTDVEDYKILREYAIKHGAKSIPAYVNHLKKTGAAEGIIKEYKVGDRYRDKMFNRTQQVIEDARQAAELAEPPTEGWKAFGRKYGVCRDKKSRENGV